MALLLEEKETHISMSGDNHAVWNIFTDDPFWIKWFKTLGYKPTKKVGYGFNFVMSIEDIVFKTNDPKKVFRIKKEEHGV